MPFTDRSSKTIGRGFTLIEMLVVMAIISILMSLLLPAVQKSRAAARTTQCRNNLHQIGIALHNYHDNNNCFPSGTVESGPRGTALTEPAWSWAVMTLPYLEQANLFRQLDPNNRTLSTVLTNAADLTLISLPVFNCPADSSIEHNPQRAFDTQLVANSNYVASAPNGNVTNTYQPGPCGFINRGTFTGDSHIRLADITDGTSVTFLVGERRFVKKGHSSVWVGSIFRNPYVIPQATLETPYGSAFVQMQTGRMLNAPSSGASAPG